jgi:hypothetical protein
MAVTNWLARAAARAQISTATPANVEIGDIFTLTINGKSISVTATAATVANVIGLFVTAWNASTITEFAEITASDGTTLLRLTGDTAGKPFTVTSSTTDGGGAATQTLTVATPTAATGPNHWDDLNNWSGGAVPVTGDEANVDLSRGSVSYGLAQSAVTLAVLRVYRSSQTNNRLGLPLINASNYTEYRATALAIGATLCTLDADCATYIDFGSVQTNTEVLRTASSLSGIPETRLIGSHASNAWELNAGHTAIGLFPGQTSNGTTLRVNSNATLTSGPDADFVAVTNAGTMDMSGVFTTMNNESGAATIRGEQNATTLVVTGGTIVKRFSGTIADVAVGPGVIDADQDLSPATFNNTVIEAGGQIKDKAQTITHTNLAMGDTVGSLSAAA